MHEYPRKSVEDKPDLILGITLLSYVNHCHTMDADAIPPLQRSPSLLIFPSTPVCPLPDSRQTQTSCLPLSACTSPTAGSAPSSLRATPPTPNPTSPPRLTCLTPFAPWVLVVPGGESPRCERASRASLISLLSSSCQEAVVDQVQQQHPLRELSPLSPVCSLKRMP